MFEEFCEHGVLLRAEKDCPECAIRLELELRAVAYGITSVLKGR